MKSCAQKKYNKAHFRLKCVFSNLSWTIVINGEINLNVGKQIKSQLLGERFYFCDRTSHRKRFTHTAKTMILTSFSEFFCKVSSL